MSIRARLPGQPAILGRDGRRMGAGIPTQAVASFDPLSITGLKGWWKADSLSLNDDDPVGTWTDSSGNGFDFTQGTAAAKPTYKTNLYNGKPAVRFDGTDDWLSAANFAHTVYKTVYAVAKFSTTAAKQFFVEHGPTSNTTPGFVFVGTSGSTWRIRQTSSGTTDKNTACTGVAGWMGADLALIELHFDGTFSGGGSNTYFKNAVGQMNNGGAHTIDADLTVTDTLYFGARAGSAFFREGELCELLIYDGWHDPTGVDTTNIRSYLNGKYAVY